MSSLTLSESWVRSPGWAIRTRFSILGKILKEQTQPAEGIDAHQVGVVDDRYQHFAGVVDAFGLLNETSFAAKVPAVGVDLERLAQDAQG